MSGKRASGRSARRTAKAAPAKPEIARDGSTAGVGVPLANPSPVQTIGVSGTAIYSGIVAQREKNPKLTGNLKWRTFANLLANRVEVGSSALFYLALGGKPAWKWPARTGTPMADAEPERAAKIADQVAGIVSDLGPGMTWRRLVRCLLVYRLNGYTLAEMSSVRRPDGMIGLRVAARPSHTVYQWLRAPDGTIAWVVQRSPQDGSLKPIPRWKLIYVVFDALAPGNPEGLGLLRMSVDAVEALKAYEDIEGIGYDSSLAGVPLVRAPLDLIAKDTKKSEAEKEAILSPLEDIVSKHTRSPDQGYLLDSAPYRNSDGTIAAGTRLYDIESIRGDASGQPAIGSAIDRKKHEIHALLGSEFLLVGSQGAGSHALSAQKLDMAALSVDGALADVAEAIYNDLVRLLGVLNGWPEELLPIPQVDRLTMRDVAEVTAALRDLATAGAVLTADDPAVNEVREQLGLSPAPEVEPMLAMPSPPPGMPVPPSDTPPPELPDEPPAAPTAKRRRRST